MAVGVKKSRHQQPILAVIVFTEILIGHSVSDIIDPIPFNANKFTGFRYKIRIHGGNILKKHWRNTPLKSSRRHETNGAMSHYIIKTANSNKESGRLYDSNPWI
jgi:hypothetical protein